MGIWVGRQLGFIVVLPAQRKPLTAATVRGMESVDLARDISLRGVKKMDS